jgi:hypothetical protein
VFEKAKAKLEEMGKGEIVLKKDDGEVVVLKTYADRIAKGETIEEKKESLEEVTEEGKAKGQVAKRAEKAGERAKQAREAKAKREAELKEAEVGLNPAQKNELQKNAKRFKGIARGMAKQNPEIQDDLANAAAVAAAEHIKTKGNLKDFNPSLSMLNWINENAGGGIGGRGVAKEMKGKLLKGEDALEMAQSEDVKFEQESGFEQDQIEEDARQLGLELDADRQTPVEMSDLIEEYVEGKATEGEVDMGPLLRLKERAGTIAREMTPKDVMKLTRQERVARYKEQQARERIKEEAARRADKAVMREELTDKEFMSAFSDAEVARAERDVAVRTVRYGTEGVEVKINPATGLAYTEQELAEQAKGIERGSGELDPAKLKERDAEARHTREMLGTPPEHRTKKERPERKKPVLPTPPGPTVVTKKKPTGPTTPRSVDYAVRGKALEQESEWRKEAKSKRRGNIPVKESKMVGLEVHGKNRAVNDVHEALEANTPFSRVAGKMLKKHKTDTIVVPNAAYGKRHGLYGDDVKKVLKSSYGVYDAATNTVYLNAAALSTVGSKNIQNITQRTIAHEALHSVIYNTLQKMNPNQYKAAMKKIRNWWSVAEANLPTDTDITNDRVKNFMQVMKEAESFAQLGQMREANAKFEEALTYPFVDGEVAAFLNSIPAPPTVQTSKIRSIWDWFMDHMLKNVLGIPKKTGTSLADLHNIANSMFQTKTPKRVVSTPMDQAKLNIKEAAPGVLIKIDEVGDGTTTTPKGHVQMTVLDPRSKLHGDTITSKNDVDSMRARLRNQLDMRKAMQETLGEKRGADVMASQATKDSTLTKLLNLPYEVWTKRIADPALGKAKQLIDQTASKYTPIDYILRKFVTAYGVDKHVQDLQYDFDLNKHRSEVMANKLEKEIKEIDGTFKSDTREITVSDKALNKRLLQIAEGGITSFGNKTAALRKANQKFEELERELRSRGLLRDHQFKDMTRRERARAINRVRVLEDKMANQDTDNMKLEDARKQLKRWNKERVDLIGRLQVHYKNSGVNYIRHIKDQVRAQDYMRSKMTVDAMGKKWQKRRGNFQTTYNSDTGLIETKKRKPSKLLPTDQLVSKGIKQEAHDQHLFDLYDALASAEDKTTVTKDKKGNPVYTLKGVRVKGPWSTDDPSKYPDVKYEQVPKNDNFGPLSGMYVETHIFDDMKNGWNDTSEATKAWKKIYRTWKGGKTVWNPATQMRNALSNLALMHVIGDTNLNDVRKYAAEAFKTQRQVARNTEPDSVYGKELLHDTTIFGDTTFTQQETGSDYIEDFFNSIVGKVAPNSDTLRWLAKSGPEVFQMMEQSMKSIVYMKARNDGLGVKEAGQKAQAALFDYSKIPPAIRTARNFYSPFVTFTYKALPNLAKEVARKPWKALPYYGMIMAADMAAEQFLGEDDEEQENQRRLLPEWMNREMLPGMPSHVKMPFRINDRDQYLDLSYILPWGDMNSEGEGALSWAPSWSLPNFPVFTSFASMMYNQELFTGQPIVLDTDTGYEKLKKVGEHLYNQLAPAAISTHKANKLVKAFRGDFDTMRDQPEEPLLAVMDVALGIKLRNVDYLEETMWRSKDLQEKQNTLRNDTASKYRALTRKNLSQEEFSEQMQEITETALRKQNNIVDEMKSRFMKEND